MELPTRAKPGNGERLLLVDDDPDARESMQRRLARRGYAVTTAESAYAALELLNKERFHLMLLDHNMPVMTGLELLQLLRGMYSASELPVLMLTAQADSQHLLKAFELGANDYLTKPVDFEVAMVRIASQLSRREAELALRQSEERYSLAVRGANDGLWDWDLMTGSVYYSARWKAIAGCTDAEVSAHPDEWWKRVHPEEEARVRGVLQQHLEGMNSEFEVEHRFLHKDNTYRWVRVRGLAVRAQGKPTRVAGSLSDINDKKITDPLTGLANRLCFEERLANVVERYRRDPARRFAVILIDLDRFKLVNDSLGHQAGDQLLKEVTVRMRATLRQDLVARMGGDEFAVLLENSSAIPEIVAIGERIVHALAQPYKIDGCGVFPGASAGIALASPNASPTDLIRCADIALYRAKNNGRGRLEMFDETMQAEALERLALEADLRQGLEAGQFELFYQPKVRIDTGRIEGFEALVRWRHPKRGLVSPANFIPLTEETGLIVPLGAFVLQEACAQIRCWREQYPDADPPLHVAVNLSPHQMRDPHLIEVIEGALATNHLLPDALCLEITEGALMDNTDATRNALCRIKELGLRIQIDDFGTGYSSLAYLSQFPLDGLKIDRSFVKNVLESGKEREIVRSILALGQATGLAVVAEGVETLDQANALSSLGCSEGQGYFYSPPMEVGAINVMLSGSQRLPGR